MSQNNINDSFFDGLYKEAWKGISPSGLTFAEVDFIQEMASIGQAGTVLDIMCGYGRHSLELARKGISVTAIDNLPEYISEIEQAAIHEKLPISTVRGDVVTTHFAGTFDAVICMGNSFSFFDMNDAQLLLTKISSALKDNGVFIINSWMVAEIAIRHFREKDWHYAGNFKCLLEYNYKFNPSRIESEQTIISPDGKIETVKGVDYIYTLQELETLFNKAGLKIRDVYSTPRKKKFKIGDAQIYIVAEKSSC